MSAELDREMLEGTLTGSALDAIRARYRESSWSRERKTDLLAPVVIRKLVDEVVRFRATASELLAAVNKAEAEHPGGRAATLEAELAEAREVHSRAVERLSEVTMENLRYRAIIKHLEPLRQAAEQASSLLRSAVAGYEVATELLDDEVAACVRGALDGWPREPKRVVLALNNALVAPTEREEDEA